MTKYYPFTQEQHLKHGLPKHITNFWRSGKFSSFSGVDSVKIQYAQFLHQTSIDEKEKKPSRPTIVIVPGRSESYLKYQELIFDLYKNGYNIFIIDHRGQGLSQRLLDNKDKGYVNKFHDYVEDLAFFINNIVAKLSFEQPHLLAHSMGGTITLRYLQSYSDTIKSAVISSPMIGFNTGLLPFHLATLLLNAQSLLNRVFSTAPWYFIGQTNYEATAFNDNKLSHSAHRYQVFLELYNSNKDIQLGGVTVHWLKESTKAQKKIFSHIDNIKVPLLLLQAGHDTVVCNQAQNTLHQKLKSLPNNSSANYQAIKIEGSYHELFFEQDAIRDQAIKSTLDWFKEYS